MKKEQVFFDVFPKVVPAGEESTITIRPLSRHVRFDDQRMHYVHIIPVKQRARSVEEPDYPILEVQSSNGTLRFTHRFPSEQPYQLWIEDKRVGENRWEMWKDVPCTKLCVYAVQEDLMKLRPFRGNMHIHSSGSDGVEAPEVVLAWYRRHGYDFAGLTDHGQYAPSLEGIRAYEGVKLNMKLFPGEEVHSPDNPVHIVHFGGEYSVNDLWRADEAGYRAGVEAIAAGLEDLPDEKYRFEAAACQWVFEKIRQAGGMSLLCHPNWTWYGAYNIPGCLYEYFLRHPEQYDALELINGGNEPHENLLQVAAWIQSGQNGKRAVVEGSDDSHGAVGGQWFNIGKTYVLSASMERGDLFAAIRSGLCCAVEQYPGEHARIYGEQRLVEYFQFLHDEYFPLHDDLCTEEGRLMMSWINGDQEAKQRLEACYGQIGHLQAHFFGQTK